MSYNFAISSTCLCTPPHVTKQKVLQGEWMFVLLQVPGPMAGGRSMCACRAQLQASSEAVVTCGIELYNVQGVIKQVCLLQCQVQGGSLLLTRTPFQQVTCLLYKVVHIHKVSKNSLS